MKQCPLNTVLALREQIRPTSFQVRQAEGVLRVLKNLPQKRAQGWVSRKCKSQHCGFTKLGIQSSALLFARQRIARSVVCLFGTQCLRRSVSAARAATTALREQLRIQCTRLLAAWSVSCFAEHTFLRAMCGRTTKWAALACMSDWRTSTRSLGLVSLLI